CKRVNRKQTEGDNMNSRNQTFAVFTSAVTTEAFQRSSRGREGSRRGASNQLDMPWCETCMKSSLHPEAIKEDKIKLACK
ncbi:hypothetical protein Bpfe_030664, partial [Biomphalaria pfeifferi]